MKLSGLLRRAAPLLIVGAAGVALGRYLEATFSPRPALPAPQWPPVPAPPSAPPKHAGDLPPDAEVRAYRVAHEEGTEPVAPVAVTVTREEEAAAETSEQAAIDPDGVEPPDDDQLEDGEDPPGERPSTVDFEALAGHPALRHRRPGDSPELAVRAAIADVGVVHAAGVSVQVRDGVAYLRGEVESAAAIGAMQRRAAEVAEIRAVDNQMHLPDTSPS